MNRWSVLIIALLLHCAHGAEATARLAIVPDKARPPAPTTIERIEAALSGTPDLALLERAKVEAILTEQSLRAVLADDAPRIGELLQADLILVVAGSASPGTCRARVIECRSGVVLGSRFIDGIPTGKPAGLAEAASLVANSAGRWRADTTQRRYVSLLGVRNEEGGQALDGLASALTAFLRNDLSTAPQVVLLEREAAEHLARERDLSGRELALVQASRLASIGIRHQDGDAANLVVSLMIRQPGQPAGTTATLAVPAGDLPRMRREIAAALLKALDAGAAQPAQARPAEGLDFIRQAQLLIDHGELTEAEQALNAARLIDPSIPPLMASRLWNRIALAYVKRLESAGSEARAGMRQGALRAACAEMLLIYSQPASLKQGPGGFTTHQFIWSSQTRDQVMPPPGDEESTRLWRDLQAMTLDYYLARQEALKADPKLSAELRGAGLSGCKDWSTPEQWRAILEEGIASCDSELPADAQEPEVQRRIISAYQLAYFWKKNRFSYMPDPWTFNDARELAVAQWMAERLARHRDPLHRIVGLNLQAQLESGSLTPLIEALGIFAAFPDGHPYFAAMSMEKSHAAASIMSETFAGLRARDPRYLDHLSPVLMRLVVLPNTHDRLRDTYGLWLQDLRLAGRIDEFDRAAGHFTDPHLQAFIRDLRQRFPAPSDQPASTTVPDVPPDAPKPVRPPEAWDGWMMKRLAGTGWPNDRGMIAGERRQTRVGGRIDAGVLDGNRLVVLRPSYGHERPDAVLLRLVSIPLSGERPTLLGSAWLPHQGDESIKPLLATSGDAVFIGGKRAPGLVRIAEGKATVWTSKEGWNFGAISALACLDGLVYAGTGIDDAQRGAGSLIVFDPATGSSRLLATSQAQAPASALDGGDGYTVTGIIADPVRHCLWLGIDGRQQMGRRGGVWRYDPADGSLKRLGAVKDNVAILTAGDGRLAVVTSRKRLLLVDPERDAVVLDEPWRHIRDGMPVPCAGTVARILANGDGAAIGADDGGPSYRFFPDGRICANFELLAPTGDGFVLGDIARGSFWLARPKAAVAGQAGWVPAAIGHDQALALAWDRLRQADQLDFDRLSEDERYQKRLALYNAAIAVVPDRCEPLVARSTLFANAERMDDALADIKRALELEPGNPDALCNRALIRSTLGDWDGAIADLQLAATVDLQPEIVLHQIKRVEMAREAARPKPAAAAALPAFNEIKDPELAAILRGATSDDAKVRLQTLQRVFAGDDVDPALASAVPLLINLLDDPDRDVSFWAVIALGKIGKPARPAVTRLLEFVADPDMYRRSTAALALGGIAEEPESVLPKLHQLLDDPEPAVVVEAVKAIGGYGPSGKPYAERLIAIARSASDTGLASVAAVAHWQCTGDPHPALQVLLVHLKHEDGGDRLTAASAIHLLGADAKPAIPDLLVALRGKDEPWADSIRICAANALGAIGPPAAEAAPTLDAMSRAGNLSVRAATSDARWRITGQDTERNIKVLLEAIASDDWGDVQMGLYILGDMGPAAAAAIPAIKAVPRDQYGMVERLSARALRKINGAP